MNTCALQNPESHTRSHEYRRRMAQQNEYSKRFTPQQDTHDGQRTLSARQIHVRRRQFFWLLKWCEALYLNIEILKMFASYQWANRKNNVPATLCFFSASNEHNFRQNKNEMTLQFISLDFLSQINIFESGFKHIKYLYQ